MRDAPNPQSGQAGPPGLPGSGPADPSGPSERWRRAGRGLLALAGLAVCVELVRRFGLDALLDTLRSASPSWLALYVGWIGLLFTGFAVRTRFLLRALDETRPTLGRLLEIRLAGLAVGSLTPGAKLGGEPLRAWLLVKSGVGVGPAVGVTAVDRSLELLANLAFAVGYVVLFARRDPATAAHVLAVVGLAGGALVGLLVVLVRRLRAGRSMLPASLVRFVERAGGSAASVLDVDRAVRRLVETRVALLVGCLGSALLLNGMVFAEYAILFRAFGLTPTVPELAGVLIGVGLAHALPVPASLGALEGAQVAIVALAGGPASLGLAAATVARVRDVAWTIPGALCLIRDGVGLMPGR